MINDMRTVLWKEWKSLFRQPGGRLRMVLTVAIPVGYFGIIGPLQSGAGFVTEAGPWFIATVLPLLTVIMTAPDSFAGERERKTLRTLLASRLSDSAILWAKTGFAVLLGLGMMVSTLILAHIAVNLSAGSSGLVLIAADRLLYMIGVSLLLSTIAAGAAVLISLRAQTVQQAQQTLTAAFFLVPTVLGPIVLITSDDGGYGPIERLFQNLGTPAGRIGLTAGMVALASILLVSARIRFRRSKLSS